MSGVIHTRRYNVTLWRLDEELNPVEELGQITKFTTAFSLNTIPTAYIELPHGIPAYKKIMEYSVFDIRSDVEKAGGMDQYVKERTPFGVYVEINNDKKPCHSISSDAGEEDDVSPSKERLYWKTGRNCIFKGYATSLSLDRDTNGISSVLVLSHWLSNLARIPIYNPRCMGTNVLEFSVERFATTTTLGDDQKLRGWAELYVNDSLASPEGLWDVVSKLFKAIIQDDLQLQQTVFGSIANDIVDPIVMSIDKIKVHDSTNYSDAIQENIIIIQDLIRKTVGEESLSGFLNVTAWEKLLGAYLPPFFLAINPLVDSALIVQRPSTVSQQYIEILGEEVLGFKTNILNTPIISGVCVATTGSFGIDGQQTGAYRFPSCIYPSQDTGSFVRAGGPIKIVQLPAWIDNISYLPVLTPLDCNVPLAPLQEPKEKGQEEKKQEDIKTAKEIIAGYYTQQIYLSEVFSPRVLTIQLPFRGDIAAGAMVKVTIKAKEVNKEKDYIFYGIVQCVVLMIDETSCRTEIGINNIRTETEFNDPILNPKKEVFFKEQWSGIDTTLYPDE